MRSLQLEPSLIQPARPNPINDETTSGCVRACGIREYVCGGVLADDRKTFRITFAHSAA